MDNLLKRIIIFKALFLGDAIHNSLLGLGSFLIEYNMLVDKYKGMTLEEMKQAKKARSKAYKDANKDSIAVKSKAYRAKNKEKTRAYGKARYEAKKEEILADNKVRYQNNRDVITAKQRIKYQKNKEQEQARGIANYKSNKLPYNIVYCIPNYNGKGDNYAGITDNPTNRMAQHKYKGVLNTSEWYELGKVEDRIEAKALENAFHKLGYHGAYGYKNKAA